MSEHRNQQTFFIKICGLTDLDTAAECSRLGANAREFVFFKQKKAIQTYS